MVNTWTDGYVTDIEYTYGYYAELNPLRARLPLLFSGIPLPCMQGSNGQPQAWEQLAAMNQRILKDGKTIESTKDNLAELSRQAEEFADKRLPILEALGVE